MPDTNIHCTPVRIASVIASQTAGGIGPVCRYAAEGLARLTDWQVTLLNIRGPVSDVIDPVSGVRIVGLGLDGNCARLFLEWLKKYPQDILITSDVPLIEPAFQFLPPSTRHIVQIHDSGRRYRDVAVRHAAWVDGVTCVGQHIEAPLRRSLEAVGFRGLLRTVHNGANFPPALVRSPHDGPLRLLFMGRLDPFKGIADMVPLLQQLQKLRVPVTLTIAGGQDETLARDFRRKRLDHLVTWAGRVPHAECYSLAVQHDVFLVLSRKESFGMTTIEAMSMGCVPIAYDIISGSSEIIHHGKSGLLLPLGDIRGWAEQIQMLHHDRERLASLAQGAIERSRNYFNADIMAQNMSAFLTDVMAHAKDQPARREAGTPPETPVMYVRPKRGYQRLPAGLRQWIRYFVCKHPKFSYWLLKP